MKNDLASTFRGWSAVFAIWIVWESAIRIFLFHKPWTPSTTFFYVAQNVIFSMVIAWLLASAHLMVRLLRRGSRKYEPTLSGTICAGLTFLLAVPVFLQLRLLSFLAPLPGRFHIVATGILICSICLVLFWMLHFLARFWKFHSRAKPAITLLLVPLIVVIAIQGFRNHQFERKQSGSDGIHYIILISIDTLRHDFVGIYGTHNAQTPNMDRIASEGALFETAISSIPQTGPSHTSMLTGVPPLVHGVLANGQRLPQIKRTLVRELRDAGYRTGAFVSGYPLKAPNCGLDPDFQIYNDHLAFIDRFEEIYLGQLASLLPIFDFGVYRQAQEVTDPALQWLSKNADHRFFLFLHYYDPHYPYGIKPKRRHTPRPMWLRTPPSDVERQRKLYAKEVESVDLQLGRVVALLKERGIYDRTLLIVTADHGESLGEHNYFYDHKNYVYEQLLRVPLMLRCPPRIKAGVVFKPQVALLDIYRTILNAAGIPPKEQQRGFDLIGLIHAPPDHYARKLVSHNYNYHISSLRTDTWKLIETKENSRLSYELFNLSDDPGEIANLFQKRKEKADQLLTEMKKLLSTESAAGDRNMGNLTPEQVEALRSLGYLN